MKEATTRPRWPVTLTVAGVIVTAGAAAIAEWPHAWWWLAAVMAAAAAAVPPTVAALWQSGQRQQEIARAARAGLQGTAGRDGGSLPAAVTADLEARVHPTVLPIPYIHRDEEATVRAHLRAGRPVLLIGSSMVGKTKMTARVIAEEFGSWPVAIPDTKTALADLDAQDVILQQTVIWLDDIDRLIGADGITDGALRRLAGAGNVIAGTIRARAYEQFRPSDELRPPEWDVLSVFEHVFISRELSLKEQQRLAEAISDPALQDRIRNVGLGEYAGAARQVAEALQLGAAGADSIGYALVLATADWRRSGMTRPIPAAMLKPLATPHLDQRGQARLADPDAFKAGLAWATRDINPNVSILQITGADSYILYDYALDLITSQGVPIPDSSWAAMVTDANPSELATLGYTAVLAYQRYEIAIQAWRKVAESGHAQEAPRAAFNLGALLKHLGDAPGAIQAYQQALNSGDTEVAPSAAAALATLLVAQGDIPGAIQAYQQALNSGDTEVAPSAAAALGALLVAQGDVPGATQALQQAIDSGHTEARPLAEISLALLLEKQGNVPGAKQAYQQVIDSNSTDLAPQAAINLGRLLEEQGDVPGAQLAYQQAIGSSHPDMAPKAAFNLGRLLEEQGDVPGAQLAYQQAIGSSHPDMAPGAALALGMLLNEQENIPGATQAFQQAIDSGHAEVALWAEVNLGVLLEEQGDVPGAIQAYQQAIDSGDPAVAPLAAVRLGLLLEHEEDLPGARHAYQQAIDSGHAEARPKAAFNLGSLLKEQGDVPGARHAYQQAIDSGHAEVAPLATANLGLLPHEQEDTGTANAHGGAPTLSQTRPDAADAAARDQIR